MAASQYAVDALQAVRLQLVRSSDATERLEEDERKTLSGEFAPLFTYAVLGGESQTIFGYSQDLKILLSMAAGSLLTHVDISYTDQIPATSTTSADDVEAALYEKLSADYLTNKGTFMDRVKADEASFKPVGKRIGAYGRKLVVQDAKGKAKQTSAVNGTEAHWIECDPEDEGAVAYEAWAADMNTPGFRDLHRRMQIFVLLYIEGGSYLDEEDTKWEFVVLYEKRKAAEDRYIYSFVGFTSLYGFFCYPDKTRLRLSQCIILPPYQNSGHGAHLYSVIYFWLLTRPEISELAVEDPSEAFQDLRDKIDLGVLLAQEAVLTFPLDKEMLKETRKAMKLGERQFARILEMAVMLKLGEGARENQEFRLMVKERLYRFNYVRLLMHTDGLKACCTITLAFMQDKLHQLESKERKDLLASTFDSVILDYERIVASLMGGEDADDLDAIEEEDEEE